MENLPNLTTARATAAAGPRARGRATTPRLAAAVTVLLLASCSHSTGGTATSGPTSVSATAAAPGPRTSAAPPSPAPASDEDQAKDTVNAFNDAYNSQNWEAYSELMCTAMRAQFTGVAMDYLKKGRVNNGPATIKSMTIAIDGDTATATIDGASEALGPGTIKLPLKREDGWKVCQVFQR